MKRILLYTLVALVVIVAAWWLMSRTVNAPSVTSPTPTVSISPSTSPTTTLKPTATAQPNLTITSPKKDAIVGSPVTVTGRARIFENQFSVAVTDMEGKVIVQKEGVMSDAKDAGQFGNYSVQLDVPPTAPKDIKIVAYAYSAKGDGSYEGYAEVAVHLKGLLIEIK